MEIVIHIPGAALVVLVLVLVVIAVVVLVVDSTIDCAVSPESVLAMLRSSERTSSITSERLWASWIQEVLNLKRENKNN